MEKILSPEEISIKYVHGHHDALTDSQEKNDMSKNIQQYAEWHTSESNKEVIRDIKDKINKLKFITDDKRLFNIMMKRLKGKYHMGYIDGKKKELEYLTELLTNLNRYYE